MPARAAGRAGEPVHAGEQSVVPGGRLHAAGLRDHAPGSVHPLRQRSLVRMGWGGLDELLYYRKEVKHVSVSLCVQKVLSAELLSHLTCMARLVSSFFERFDTVLAFNSMFACRIHDGPMHPLFQSENNQRTLVVHCVLVKLPKNYTGQFLQYAPDTSNKIQFHYRKYCVLYVETYKDTEDSSSQTCSL